MFQRTHTENVLLGVHAITIQRETCGTRGCNLNGALLDIALKSWLTWNVLKVTAVRQTVL